MDATYNVEWTDASNAIEFCLIPPTERFDLMPLPEFWKNRSISMENWRTWQNISEPQVNNYEQKESLFEFDNLVCLFSDSPKHTSLFDWTKRSFYWISLGICDICHVHLSSRDLRGASLHPIHQLVSNKNIHGREREIETE